MEGYAQFSTKQISVDQRATLIRADDSECTSDAFDDAVEIINGRISSKLTVDTQLDRFNKITVQKIQPTSCKLKLFVTLCGSGILIGLALILHFYNDHPASLRIGDVSYGWAELSLSEKTLKIFDQNKNIKLTIMLAGNNYPSLKTNFQKCSNSSGTGECVIWPSHGIILKINYFTLKSTPSANMQQTQCYKVTWSYHDKNRAAEDCIILDDVHNHHGGQSVWFDTKKYLLWPRLQEEVCTSSCHSFATGWNGTTRHKVHKYNGLGGNIVEPLWVSSRAIFIRASLQYPLMVCEKLCQNLTHSKLCLKGKIDGSPQSQSPTTDSNLSYIVCSGMTTLQVSGEAMASVLGSSQYQSKEKFSDISDEDYLANTKGYVLDKTTSFDKCKSLFNKPLWNIEFNGKSYDMASIKKELLDIQAIGGTVTINNLTKIFTSIGDFQLRNDSDVNFLKFIHSIHSMGFEIMLPISPFVNYNSDNFQQALNKNLLMKNRHEAPALTYLPMLGTNVYPGVIDFTNPDAFKWFLTNVAKFKKKYAIDYIHLCYGQEVLLPDQYKVKNTLSNPSFYSSLYTNSGDYINSCPVTDVAFSSQSEHQIILLNAADDLENTLKLALAAGLAGYPYFIPNLPYRLAEATMFEPKVLEDGFIRWIQLVSFFPVAHMPWDYHYLNEIGVNITRLVSMTKKCMSIRHSSVVRQAFDDAFSIAESIQPRPVVAPIWMSITMPTNLNKKSRREGIYKIQDQFMIGKDVLIAPVLQMGQTERDIYFPAGQWMKFLHPEEDAITSDGKLWVKHYKADLNDVMVFIRQPGSTLFN